MTLVSQQLQKHAKFLLTLKKALKKKLAKLKLKKSNIPALAWQLSKLISA